MELNNSNALTKQSFGTGIKISFIIVNYKSQQFIPACLSSIKNSCRDVDFEIIIANNDNAVSDFPEVKIVNLEKNRGFGAGCNAGAKIAQGEILCFLNPDTKILENIDKIINCFNNYHSRESGNPVNKSVSESRIKCGMTFENIGIIGPRLITQDGQTQNWCAGCETNLWNLIRNNLSFPKSKKIWTSQKTVECDWVSGAALFIKKELFDRLNGFDEKFFMYFEDEDLCKRARILGYKVIYFPKFSVRHFGGKSFTGKFKQKKLYYSSLIQYLSKN